MCEHKDQPNTQEAMESTDNSTNAKLIIPPRRLHPAAMFFNLVNAIKETIFGLGIGLILTLKGSLIAFIGFVTLFLLVLIVTSILSWLRFTYRVEGDELRIEQGIFIRKKRYISIHRIHKLDISANVIHRIFKLAKVQIDTASSGDGAEVTLSAVTLKDAKQLRQALKPMESKDISQELNEEKNPIERMTWRRLFIAGSTSGGIGVILFAMWIGYSQIEEIIPKDMYDSTFMWIEGQGIFLLVGVIFLFLFVLWLLAIAGTMIKYGHFTIEKRKEELFIKRGLLETKELTIPFGRIQAIGIEQSIIRQPLKLVRVFAVVAGGSMDDSETFPVLFPLMREHEVEKFLAKFTPEHPIPTSLTFTPLAKKGLKYYLIQSSLLFVFIFLSVLYFYPVYSWIPLLFVVIGLFFGWLRYRDGGYAILGKQLTIRHRRFHKVTITTYAKRIQALEKSQHKLQQMDQLATTSISLIGSSGLGTHYSLRHLTDQDANMIADWYSYRKEKKQEHLCNDPE